MLIISRFKTNEEETPSLNGIAIEAYVNDKDKFRLLKIVLKSAGIDPNQYTDSDIPVEHIFHSDETYETTFISEPPKKTYDYNRTYFITNKELRLLEKELGGVFQDFGDQAIYFPKSSHNNHPYTQYHEQRPVQHYSCYELIKSGKGNNCEGIITKSKDHALFECALIASQNGWLGASPQSGKCPD